MTIVLIAAAVVVVAGIAILVLSDSTEPQRPTGGSRGAEDRRYDSEGPVE